jgi:2-polyprenyl-3-methyl-5-hydroxy-6-metoxy-1,4-benzoquinol methylase
MSFKDYYLTEIKKYGGIDKYILAKSIEKKPLLERVMKFAYNKKIIEAGSGSSTNSTFLASRGYNVTAVDSDSKMTKLSKLISKNKKNKPNFITGKIEGIKDKDYSVVFSHGVLEHFNDGEIIDLINKELTLGSFLVFSIPSDYFKPHQAINGDERFLSIKEWRELIKRSNGVVIEEFSYFYDPDNLKLYFLKFLDKITFSKLPIKKPYIGFVVKKNVHNT